jgi:hypothetical protein
MKSFVRLIPILATLWLASCGTGRVSLPATILIPTWTFTHVPPPGILLPTFSPTRREPPTWTPTPPPTATPVPSSSPTLGPLITRTPAPPAECPPPGNPAPIRAESLDNLIPQVEDFLANGGQTTQLETAITENLAAYYSSEGQPTVSVAEVDLTGDGIGELVIAVELVDPGMGLRFALVVLGCERGEFRILLDEWAAESGMAQMDFYGAEDLNGNGVPEIVYSIEEFGAHDSISLVSIREWDAGGFQPLVLPPSDHDLGNIRAAYMGGLLSVGDVSTYDLGMAPDRTKIDSLLPDIDGNGTRELILRGGGGRAYSGDGPQRVSIETWSWNGEAFTLSASRFDPPEYRFQAVRDGDAAFLRGNLEEAMAFYQQSLDDPELLGWSIEHLQVLYPRFDPPPVDPAERARLAAFAEFRMLLVYAVQERQPDAQSLFDAMVGEHLQGSPGYPYVQIATRFHDALEAAGSVQSACAAAREYAQANAEAILKPLGSQFYGYLYEDYSPESICPVE